MRRINNPGFFRFRMGRFLTGEAKKIREVSRLERVQLTRPFSILQAAVGDAASVSLPKSGQEDAWGNSCGAGEESVSEVRIPGEHLPVDRV
jgi:hypothetical protein